jgi:hypothetical protein
VAQAVPAHLYGQQFCTPGARQVPEPSQVPAVSRRVPAHDGGEQIVSAAYIAQPPKPSHVPVWPHEATPSSLQTPCGSGMPGSTGQHVPTRPTTLQLTQLP